MGSSGQKHEDVKGVRMSVEVWLSRRRDAAKC